MDALLTTAEVAALTRAPEASVRFWRFQGTGPKSFKVGRRVVYRAADVQAWLEEQERADNQRHALGTATRGQS